MKQVLTIPERARAIARTLGTYRAARYLFKRGVPLFSAKLILGLPARVQDLNIFGAIDLQRDSPVE